jgi:two-component system sensor histidine kinase HydH
LGCQNRLVLATQNLHTAAVFYELRARTAVVCGALALAIAASALLRKRARRVDYDFGAFAVAVGCWYLAQSFYGFFQADVWQRSTAILAVLVPLFAVKLFEAIVPVEPRRASSVLRFAALAAAPLLLAQLAPFHQATPVRIAVFAYVFAVITVGLYALGQRGATSPSRATQRRVRILVVIGALAGLATLVELLSYLGIATPPVGAVFSVLFLFALSQALERERLLDLSELLSRLTVSAAVAFLIAFIFYVLLTFAGTFGTMYLNAVLAATVVLVVFEPLRARVEEQIQRLFFRERFDFEGALAEVRRRLVHTLDVGEMSRLVMNGLERSRRVTEAGLYLRDPDGMGFECTSSLGEVPGRIEVATARVLLERLEKGSLLLEALEQEAAESDRRSRGGQSIDAVRASAEVLGVLRTGALVAIRDESREIVGLLVAVDRRVRDALSLEEVALLEQLAAQIAVVLENSQSYQRMKERDRLALLGQMAAGLAHEIRNPLGAIKGAAQLLAEPDAPVGDASTHEFAGIIVEEVDRLNRVVGSVLDLARPNDAAVVPIEVNAVVRRTLQILRSEPDLADVDVAVELAADVPRVAIDAEQLRQVLMNLLRNAAHAVGQQGKVTITSRARTGRLARAAGAEGSGLVEIAVSDTGPGISRVVLEKLFLPFFTTKEKGTGLGLAISQRIVQGAGGRIDVRSAEGKGSHFIVVLPAAAPRSDPHEVGRAGEAGSVDRVGASVERVSRSA